MHLPTLLPATLSLLTLASALPDPATLFRHQQNPHQVGFVLPPHQSPPYGKSLPPTTYSSGSRNWDWTQWLHDAKSVLKSVFVKQRKPDGGKRVEDDRNVGRFDNDIVLRVNVTSLEDRMAIAELAESMILDIWSATPKHVDIRLPRTSVKGFLSLLPAHLTQHEPIITNLRAAVDYTYPSEQTSLPSLHHLLSMSKSESARRDAEDIHFLSDIFFNQYQSYDTITQWMYLLESLRPELVSVVDVGKTYENKTISGLVIKGKNTKGEKKDEVKGMLLQGAQHAREWISVSTVCYIAYQLVSGYYTDNTVRHLVDEFEWNLFPVVNVDGYEYSWTTDRLWRKNRQPTPVPFCTGIDPDKSWGYMWDAPGSKTFNSNPCSESYRGEKAFQAVEAQRMATYISKTLPGRNVKPTGYIDFHSYSQMVLYPYAFDCSVLPRDAEDIAEAAWGMAKAARQVHGRYFNVDSACEGDHFNTNAMQVINGGTALDWAYAKGKFQYTYTIRLRDTGNHGFLLPQHDIVPSGEEMFAVAKSLGGFILEKPGGPWQ